MRGCSASLSFGDTAPPSSQVTSVVEDVERGVPSSSVGVEIRTVWRFLKKLK